MRRHTAQLVVAAVVAAPALFALPSSAGAQAIGVEELRNMEVPTGERIERGARIYDNQCAGCHGDDGTGLGSYPDQKFDDDIPDLTDREYRYGGSALEIYEYVTVGPEEAYHPTFNNALRYQERWAVTHFVRAWGLLGERPTSDHAAEAARVASREGPKAPEGVREQATTVARKGRCAPDVMEQVQDNIGSQLEAKGAEQLERGKSLYQENGCTSCHGAEGKVTEGMENLEIPPRNFRTKEAQWQNGPNPLSIFNVLTNGARGQMRSYKNQIEPEGRWAIAHFLLEKWVPKEAQTEVGETQLLDLCREKSASEPPAPMWTWEQFDGKRQAIDHAMERLAADRAEERAIRLRRYGDVRVAAEADKQRGRRLFQRQCARCHGTAGKGVSLGPFGVERTTEANRELPRLRVQVRPLTAAHAGGTYRDFAERASSGVHATLPEMSPASLLSSRDWKDLHAYIASLEGGEEAATIRPEIIEVPSSKLSDGPGIGGDSTDGADAGSPGGSSQRAAPDASGTGSNPSQNAEAE